MIKSISAFISEVSYFLCSLCNQSSDQCQQSNEDKQQAKARIKNLVYFSCIKAFNQTATDQDNQTDRQAQPYPQGIQNFFYFIDFGHHPQGYMP